MDEVVVVDSPGAGYRSFVWFCIAQRGGKRGASVEVEGGDVTAARVVVVDVLTHDCGGKYGNERWIWIDYRDRRRPKRALYSTQWDMIRHGRIRRWKNWHKEETEMTWPGIESHNALFFDKDETDWSLIIPLPLSLSLRISKKERCPYTPSNSKPQRHSFKRNSTNHRITIFKGDVFITLTPIQIHQKPHSRSNQPPCRHIVEEPHHGILQRNARSPFILPLPHNSLSGKYHHLFPLIHLIPNHQPAHHRSLGHSQLNLILPPRYNTVNPADQIPFLEI